MSVRYAIIATMMILLILVVSCGKAAPTVTPVPPTATAIPPTETPVPPTATVVPPTETATPIPPTATPAPTHTAVPPTATPVTATPVPPTASATPITPTPDVPKTSPAVAPIIAGLQGLTLDDFFEESWKQLRLRDPEGITYDNLAEKYGMRNDQLNNLSDVYIRETQELEAAILYLLRTYDRAVLTPEQQISYDVYEWYLDNQVRGHEFMYYDYPVHHFLDSYHDELNRLFTEIHPLTSKQDAEDYVARLSQVDDQVEQLLEGLGLREEAEVIPPRFIVEMAQGQLVEYLQMHASDPTSIRAESLQVYTVFSDKLDEISELNTEEKEGLRQAALMEIEVSFIPAYLELLEYVDYLVTIATDDAGVWKFPNGDAYYAYVLREQTSTDLTPQEVHELGLAEVERIRAEMRQAFNELGYPADASLDELLDRAAREVGYYDIRSQEAKEQLIQTYEALLAEVDQRVGEAFDIRPRAQVEVVGGPMGGYYVPGSKDGSRPGAYHVATTGSWASNMYMAPVAYHEAIPGHHFQIAIGQELDLPAFRNDVFFNGYGEGWALYAERLAWELGMYDDDPYGNIGRLYLELLRAVRLVADTGIHAMGWTREEANAYMAEAFGAPRGTTFHEVDRYIVIPAQATGYKIGMLKILELRRRAMERLGDRFDLKKFHNMVLGNGSLPLEILERVVNDYIETALGQ